MSDPVFFAAPAPLTLARIVALTGATLPDGVDPDKEVTGFRSLDRGEPGDICFLESAKRVGDLARTRATAVLVQPRHSSSAPDGVVGLVTPRPQAAFARVVGAMMPSAMRPTSFFGATGIAPGAIIHPTARLEANVTVDPGVVIGPDVEIGAGAVICANAAIGPSVRIGRDGAVGAGASIQHALIGDRVIIHPGVRIGQDGFGYAMGPGGHVKIPQVGRVIIQNDVEIGANSTIDRGASGDTVVGEGTKIDNLVQIAHNVSIGRHCILIAQVGLSGSTVVEDYAVLAGQAGVADHVRIGAGAQIAAKSGVMSDVPPGVQYGGAPAKPWRQWLRETAVLERLTVRSNRREGGATETEEPK